MADMIALANSAAALRISVDIPTGLMADTPHILGEVFRADVTVTFTRPKVSLHLAPSKAFCGEIIVKQVGLPQELITSPLHLLTEENTPHPPERTPFGYKNIYGHAVVVGGSLGKSGAAVIAACAALRSGAGLVACILPKSLIWALAAHPELMSFEAETDNIFSEKDASRILAFLKPDMTLAIGPGLGRDEQTLAFVRALIKGWAKQMVIDADALYALDEKTLALLTGRVALTPHFGEFLPLASRCFGAMDKQELILNRLEISREYAKRYSLFLLLKGSEMIISCPDGEQFISEWGSPCLSKGGSGDILTGVITALIAQGVKMQDALKTACRIQGTAGRIAAKGRCAYSVTPADIINSIGILES
jgi:NAD(P)H-hydrate epimerase